MNAADIEIRVTIRLSTIKSVADRNGNLLLLDDLDFVRRVG